MKQQIIITCQSCKDLSAVLHWEIRYKGFRGTCMSCGSDWPES